MEFVLNGVRRVLETDTVTGRMRDVQPEPVREHVLDDAQDEDVTGVCVIAGERAPFGLMALVRGASVSGWPDSVSAQRRRAE